MVAHLYKDCQEQKPESKSLTNTEAYLWILLHNRSLEGRKFHRQYPIGGYLIDFYCPEEKLAIIIEGDDLYTSFSLESEYERKCYLESQGIKVLTFNYKSVFHNNSEVLKKITREMSSMYPRHQGKHIIENKKPAKRIAARVG